MRPELRCDARTREVARLVLGKPPPGQLPEPLHALTMQAGVDLLPPWARRLHGLRLAPLGPPLVRAGTLGLARAVRWAFD